MVFTASRQIGQAADRAKGLTYEIDESQAFFAKDPGFNTLAAKSALRRKNKIHKTPDKSAQFTSLS